MNRKTDNFNKFFVKKNNAAIKEEFKQEKKAFKKERKEAIEKHFEDKRKKKEAFLAAPKSEVKVQRKTQNGKQPTENVQQKSSKNNELIPLNKYLSHSGVSSRRDAAELIRVGKVTVNGIAVTEPGTKVSPEDLVKSEWKKNYDFAQLRLYFIKQTERLYHHN